MREMRAGTQPGAGTMSPRQVSAPVLIDRVGRSTASLTLPSPEIGCGAVAHPMIPAWK
jgi:hypothetical protein